MPCTFDSRRRPIVMRAWCVLTSALKMWLLSDSQSLCCAVVQVNEVVVPLLSMQSSTLLCISTLLDGSNHYTKMIALRDETGKPVFESERLVFFEPRVSCCFLLQPSLCAVQAWPSRSYATNASSRSIRKSTPPASVSNSCAPFCSQCSDLHFCPCLQVHTQDVRSPALD